jgi:predicted Zn finger-like uncharacterized protein
MIVICTRCQARFRVADEKVGARGARIRCARCQTLFAVGPAPAATPAAQRLAGSDVRTAPEVELEAPARAAPPDVAEDDPFAGFRLDAGPPFGPARDVPRRSSDPFGAATGSGDDRGSGPGADPFAAGGTAQVAALEMPPADPVSAWDDGTSRDLGDPGGIAPPAGPTWDDGPTGGRGRAGAMAPEPAWADTRPGLPGDARAIAPDTELAWDDGPPGARDRAGAVAPRAEPAWADTHPPAGDARTIAPGTDLAWDGDRQLGGPGDAGAIAPGKELAWADDPFAAAISPRAERSSLSERTLPVTDLADLLGDGPRPPAMPPPLPQARSAGAGSPAGMPPGIGSGGPDLALEEPTTPPPSSLRAAGDDLLGGFPFALREGAFGPGPSELGGAAEPAEEPLSLATEPAPGLPEVWRTSEAFPPEPDELDASTAGVPDPASPPARGVGGKDSGGPEQAVAPPGARRAAIRSIAVNAISLAGLLVVALTFRVLWRGEGAAGVPAASPAALLRAIGLGARPVVPLDTASVTSGRYPRAAGAPLLFVRGEVISRSPAPLARVRVDVEVVRAGSIIAHRSALAGAVPTPEELHAVKDAAALEALSVAIAARAQSVRPGDPVPFLVAFTDVPEDLTGASLRVMASPAR